VGAPRARGSVFVGDAGHLAGVRPAKAVADTVEFVVQVNGKVRARMPMPRGIAEAAAREAALADENVQRFIEGKEVRKTIFVPTGC
jgi:leucyl-tRNA synthetase